MSEAAALLGVSPDTLRRWVDAGRLPAERDSSGHRRVRGSDLAALSKTIAPEAAPPPPTAQSTRNRFPGIVTRVVRGDVMSQVELQCGPHRVVSLLSTEAVDELGLVEGARAVAAVKATNVAVELAATS
jgi:molybdopterin-binding protein